MNLDDLISDTHDEPDHADDRSAGVGIVNSALLGLLAFAAAAFAVLVLIFVAAKVLA
jgi:hypothetical protein